MHRVMMVNRDLGVACAKPFAISTICVTDSGESDLLALQSNIDE
jgi:ribosomal protein L30E